MIDYPFILLLRREIEALAADNTMLRQACAGYGIPNATIDAWHDAMFPGGSTTRWKVSAALDKDYAEKHSIAVQLVDAPSENIPLGYEGDGSPDQTVRGFMTQPTIVIFMVSPSAEVTRAIFQFVKWTMLRYVDILHGLGAHSVVYQGGGDLAAEMDLMPEYGGLYTRRQRWSCSVTTVMEEDVVVPKDVRVYASDVPWSGDVDEVGGVDPSS